MKTTQLIPAGLLATLGLILPAAQGAKELQSGSIQFLQNQVQKLQGEQKTDVQTLQTVAENTQIDTGTDAFTQIDFADESVLRLGSNTRFSFQSKERLIKLEEGSLIMHIPPGNGGISVDGGGVIGEVKGSTVVASRDSAGNFCFLVMESKGTGSLTPAGGQPTALLPGQIAMFRKGTSTVRVADINLDAVMDYSPLFSRFPKEMPNLESVYNVADRQATEVMNQIRALAGTKDLGVAAADPENSILGLIFGKGRAELASSSNIFFVDPETVAGKIEAAASEGGSGSPFVGAQPFPKDARQPEGERIMAENDRRGGARGVVAKVGDEDTASGGEENTDTAAGDGGGTGTGGGTSAPVAPVGGGTAVNPPSATPRGSTT